MCIHNLPKCTQITSSLPVLSLFTNSASSLFPRTVFTSLFINYSALWSWVGLGVTCSSRDSRYAGLNVAEVGEIFQDVKVMSTNLLEGILRCRS